MRRLLPALLLAALALPAPARAQDGLSVRIDPRVELLAIVFRLAGNREYDQGGVPAYNQAIQAHFGGFRDHPAVKEAARLRQARGIGFDAVMSMAVHIDDGVTPAPRRAFTTPDASLEKRWTPEDANRFIALLADFARDSRFEQFLAANAAVLDSARAQMERVVAAGIDVPALEQYFGRRPSGAFIMVPLVTNGAGNFGVRYLEGAREEVFAVIGTSAGSSGWPLFTDAFVPTMIHEFSHSFVNPVFDPHAARLEAAGKAIYPTVEAQMRAQAYGTWTTTVNESVVRASVARYVLAKGGEEAARREVRAQRARGFLWIEELYRLLGEYEQDRAKYPALEAFAPRVVAFFDSIAPRADSMAAAYDRARPRIAALEPAADAKDVDPALTQLVIRFDRPMAPGINIRLGAGGRDAFPKVASPQWSADGTVLTLQVTLEPGKGYDLVLGGGFRDRATETPLRDLSWRFSTR